MVCPPKSRNLVRESEYTQFGADQINFAPKLYRKMIQMNEDFIEAPVRKEIYFKTLFKKGLFEGVLRSTVIDTDNRMMRWGRILEVRENVTVSIFVTRLPTRKNNLIFSVYSVMFCFRL